MSDDLNDSDLYKGFDEDGNRIVDGELVPWDCTATSLETG